MNEIKKKIPVDEILAGLAEECGELTQAALKLRRVFTGKNPTPVSEDDAIEKLYEEVADVELYIKLLKLSNSYIDGIQKNKIERWKKRLGLNDE